MATDTPNWIKALVKRDPEIDAAKTAVTAKYLKKIFRHVERSAFCHFDRESELVSEIKATRRKKKLTIDQALEIHADDLLMYAEGALIDHLDSPDDDPESDKTKFAAMVDRMMIEREGAEIEVLATRNLKREAAREAQLNIEQCPMHLPQASARHMRSPAPTRDIMGL